MKLFSKNVARPLNTCSCESLWIISSLSGAEIAIFGVQKQQRQKEFEENGNVHQEEELEIV